MNSRPTLLHSAPLIACLLAADLAAQDGIGLPSLKIDPGARQAGMAGVAAGVADDAQAAAWNPGGLGHLRRWQWTATHNRWFADLTQTSFAAAKLFSGLGSRKTALALSANYIGSPAWDATGGLAPSVTAGDLVVGLGLGQRLDWLWHALSLGANVKYVESRMDRYRASGLAGDFGLLVRPGRFRLNGFGLGLFDYGIFSFGASISHVGGKLVYDAEGTLLPRTWRAGASMRVGRHAAWSWLAAADVIGVRGRDPVVGVGSEIWWKDLLGLRMGVRSNGRDLGDFSFGAGFRWDDVLNRLLGLPTRFGDAFQIDLADVGYGEVLRQTYRGGLSHFPSAPEPFTLFDPQEARSDSDGVAAMVNLAWEEAEDPDPFDEIRYVVLVDRDRAQVKRAVERLESDWEGFWAESDRYLSVRDSLLYCESHDAARCALPVAEGGNYHWAVAAVDKSRHVRMAKRGQQKVLHFLVAVPDLIAASVTFEPAPLITTTPEQGKLTVEIANLGSAACASAGVRVEDVQRGTGVSVARVLYQGAIQSLAVNRSARLTVPWQTTVSGAHTIRVTVDPDSSVLELREGNNRIETVFTTIPKGRVSAPDSAEVMVTGYSTLEVPIVPEVYFDAQSDELPEAYRSRTGPFPSLLTVLADRLAGARPEVTLRIFGAVDALSGETDTGLADARAEAVRRELVRFGAPDGRLSVVANHPNKVLGRRPMPKDAQDAAWIMAQNRVVTFETDPAYEELLFEPVNFAVDTTLRDSVTFDARVTSPAGITAWELVGQTGALALDESRAVDGRADSLWGALIWKGTDRSKVVVPRNRWVRYELTLTDTLGRTFKTLPDSIYLQEKRTIQRQEIFGAAKFAKVEPVYAFYWDRVMSVAGEMVADPAMRLRFEGHACAIGPDRVNQILSVRRAADFTQKFLERVKAKYPAQYEDLRRRIAEPLGMGEREPLFLKLKGIGEVLLGDNASPTGRYLNRRIAVLLYREN